MKIFWGILLTVIFVSSYTQVQYLKADSEAATTKISGPLEYVPQDFDVLHYDVNLDLTQAPQKQTKGICKITFRWVSRIDSSLFYFHLRDLRIDSAFYDDIRINPVAVEIPDSAKYHYEVVPPPADKNDTVVMTIYYSGTMTGETTGAMPFGGVHNGPTILFAMGVGFSNNYVSATQHWFPCYDHPSDKATFHGRFLVKPGMAVASNGLLKIEKQDDGNNIYDWTMNNPASTYLLTFAVENYVPIDFGTENLHEVVYAKPADTNAVKFTFKLLPRMVRTFDSLFVPYPFEKVGYCMTPIGSMEHQTMISYDVNYMALIYKSKDSTNYIAAHELAHQWFGDYVTCRDFRNAWLNESFATFCESLWYENLYGFPTYVKNQRAKNTNYVNSISVQEGVFPIYDFPRKSPSSNYPNTIYQKGAVVLGMLRYELGDSVFFAAIREYLKSHAYSTATTEELKQVLEEVSGKNLDYFFNQWIYKAGYPTISVRINKTGNSETGYKAKVNVTQTQDTVKYGSYVNLPVEIGFRKNDGTYVFRVVKLAGMTGTFTFDSLPDYNIVNLNQGYTVASLMKTGDIINSAEDAPISASDFNVFPNPASAYCDVTLPRINEKLVVTLTNSAGMPIFEKTVEQGNNIDSMRIETQNYFSGVYFVTVEGKDLFISRSIVISK